MKALPTPPSPGKPVSATLIREIIDAIRERTVIGGRGTRLSYGPNGTTINVGVPSRSSPSPSSDISCFRISPSTNDEDAETSGGEDCCRFEISCCAYNLGGVMMVENDGYVKVPKVPQSQSGDGATSDDVRIIAFVAFGREEADGGGEDNPEDKRFVLYDDAEALKKDQAKGSRYVVPLYGVDGDGKIIADFRTAPQVQVWEDVQSYYEEEEQ